LGPNKGVLPGSYISTGLLSSSKGNKVSNNSDLLPPGAIASWKDDQGITQYGYGGYRPASKGEGKIDLEAFKTGGHPFNPQPGGAEFKPVPPGPGGAEFKPVPGPVGGVTIKFLEQSGN
jgi:hypothetical protein